MIVFNHNILFPDELYLDNGEQTADRETIVVLQEDPPSFFAYHSDWVEMSGRRMRYGSDGPFKDADDNFCWGIDVEEVVSLRWKAASATVFYRPLRHFTPKLLRFWVLHTFLPLVFELRHCFRMLHVGAVEVQGRALLFSAFSFGGKSTLTDFFLQQGHRLLSDDSLGVKRQADKYYAVSSYPFHRPYRELETLGYHTDRFQADPLPVHAVYVLVKSDLEAPVTIAELTGVEKFKAFHYSTFIDIPFMKRERLDYFAQMAKRVPVYKVTVPWDLERLSEVYEAITKQAASA